MKAMVLAAGFGTRLLPYTNIRPKPLFPILGRPLLLSIIERLRRSGFSTIVVNTHHLASQIAGILRAEEDIFLQEEREILGTGGGLRLALERFAGEPVLVVNADLYHGIDYKYVYEKHLAEKNQISMVMHDYERFNKVVVGENGQVSRICGGQSGLSPGEKLLAFTGVHVVNPDILSRIPLGKFSNIMDHYTDFINRGGIIKALDSRQAMWWDIGTPADYLNLHASLLKDARQVKHLIPVPRSQFFADRDVVLGKKLRLLDWGMIGAGARIGDEAQLERVVVWDGARVAKGAVHKDTIIY